MAEKLKIGVIGLGPIGQILAVFFKEAGCEVAITDLNREKLNLIRSSGIELTGVFEKKIYFKHVYNSLAELLEHDYDILVSSVKAYHVDSILTQIEGRIKPNCYLLCAQNGIGIKSKYFSHFAESQIFRMVVNFAGTLQAPNVTEVSFFTPPNYVGSAIDMNEEIADEIANLLTNSGLKTLKTDSFGIVSKVWEKTILNAALSPLCAISKLTMKEAMENPDTLELVEQIIYEAVEVANAEKIKLPENFITLCIRYLKNAGNHFPSLAVDLMNNSQTEINYMNGKIVEFGRKHYIRTPLNLAFTNLVIAIGQKNGVATPKSK